MKSKFYVVWHGHSITKPTIFYDWPSCSSQVTNYPGAKHMSFKSRQSAIEACNMTYTEASFKFRKKSA